MHRYDRGMGPKRYLKDKLIRRTNLGESLLIVFEQITLSEHKMVNSFLSICLHVSSLLKLMDYSENLCGGSV
jgi:hypothetical protein